MKKLAPPFHFIFTFFITIAIASCAQHKKIQQLWDISEPVKTPGWIVFKKEMKIEPEKLFTQYKAAFHLSEGNEMKLVAKEKDELNIEHITFQQFYKNIKIENAEFTVHAKNNFPMTQRREY